MKVDQDTYDKLPAHLRDGVRRYIEDHGGVGDFLTAVIQNDLWGAIRRADGVSLVALPTIVAWFYWEAPGNCWGSKEKHEAWIEGV